MRSVRALHREAMNLAQEAFLLRESGNAVAARALAARAFPLEAEAAALVSKDVASEPTRSILYQSAASLAFQAGNYAEAQRLAADGLAGYPPARVEQQLKETIEQINFESHLVVNGEPLTTAEMQLSIAGDDVGFGRVPWSVFYDRMSALVSMISRMARRLSGEPYRRRGRPSATARSFVPLVSIPRAGSFAVTIEVAHLPQGQQALFVSSEQVVDEVVVGAELVKEQRFDQLLLRIGERGYFDSFVSSAQILVPDGDRVKIVGLTSAKRQVSFTESFSEMDYFPVPPVQAMSRELVSAFRTTLNGILDEASVRGTEQVGLSADNGTAYTFWVREGVDDLVRNYFNRRVQVRVERANGREEIVSVRPLED